MEPLFIRSGEDMLYSVYHEPPSLSENNSKGVILCYPLGQEYIRCHKLFVSLAQKLSIKGFHVLRFDYSGTGDSDGVFEETSISQWLNNINYVKNELENGCDVKEIILVGVRFGANLALQYSKNNKINKLVLWCPIYSGKQYIESIENEYKRWLSGSFAKHKKEKGSTESFGFSFSSELTGEIKNMSITKADFDNGIPTLLLDKKDELDFDNTPGKTFTKIINDEFWLKRENEMDKSIVPIHELQFIEKWI